MKYLLLNIFVFLFSSAAMAAEKSKQITIANPGVDAWSVAQLIFGLVVVLMVIGVRAFLLKRVGGFNVSANGNMRVIGGLSLGIKEKAVLVQVGDTQILLGLAPGRVQTLHVFDEPVVDATALNKNSSGFFSQLQKAIKERGKK